MSELGGERRPRSEPPPEPHRAGEARARSETLKGRGSAGAATSRDSDRPLRSAGCLRQVGACLESLVDRLVAVHHPGDSEATLDLAPADPAVDAAKPAYGLADLVD